MNPLKRSFIADPSEWSGQGVLSILGSTGVGKTSLAITLARQTQALLVSVDSVAVFKGLDIGSSKPLGEERQGLDWIGIDIWEPNELADVDAFVLNLQPEITKALQANRPIILVGGSHFYEQALVSGRGPGEASDPAFLDFMERKTNEEIHRALIHSDSRFESKVHVADRYRLKRYSDLHLRQKISYEDLFEKKPQSFLSQFVAEVFCLPLGLDLDNAAYESRLQSRIEKMFADGFWSEVQNLIDSKVSPHAPSLKSVGYSQVVEAILAGEKEATPALIEKILIAHRQLGKRQRTWIRGLMKKAELLPHPSHSLVQRK